MNRSSFRNLTPEKLYKVQVLNDQKSPNKPIPIDKVKIYVRLRPSLNGEEWNNNLLIYDQNTIKITKSDLDVTFMKFDKIFSSEFKQKDIFQNLENAIQRFLEGENHSFFAYGQTGAGKTYTTIGGFEETNTCSSSSFLASEHRGILPRALEKVIAYIQTQDKKCTLFGSFFEVYNEKVYDLLNPKTSYKRESLELREAKDGTNKILDLLKIDIKSVEDALECLKVGLKNRMTGCSHANAKSSRSHSIFQIILTQEDQKSPNIKIISKLRIVDLAGSEKFKIPKTLDAEERELHILELTSINSSLSTLGHCITALTDSKRTHVPFRNSKLTRVLSDSLSGDSKITFIVCLSPSLESAQESFSTLQFASRAKKIILDGRHVRKKEEAIQNNLKLLNKSNHVLELFKQLCTNKNIVSAMVDPAMQSKINLLEQEIKELKMKNQALHSQVKELKRSYSPDLNSLKKSTESLHSPFKREESKKSISPNLSPSRTNFRRHASQQELSRNKKKVGFKSVKRTSSMEKKVRFHEDCFTEKVKHKMEYQDDTIFENLSIFKEMEADLKKKSLSIQDIKKIKEQRANYLKFWSEGDPDNKISPKGSPEKPLLLNLVPSGQAKMNLLAQKIKEKEIERKYELFFSLGVKQQQQEQQPENSKGDLNADLQVITPANTTIKLTGPNNSVMSMRNQNGLWGGRDNDSRANYKNLFGNAANDTFNSLEGDHELIKRKSSISRETNLFQRANMTSSEANQSLFSNNEISIIEPKPNQTIDELTEEALVSDKRGYAFLHKQEENNTRGKLEAGHGPLRQNHDNYESSKIEAQSQRDYNGNGIDIIKEFDKKLLSVHQLNEQHQELIKNIGIKFGVWQQEGQPSSASIKETDFHSNKLQPSTGINGHGRDVAQVVKDIKQELSEALNQIQDLKLADYNTSSTSPLAPQGMKSQAYLEQEGEEKKLYQSAKSIERYKWEETGVKNNNSMLGFYSKSKENKYSSNQSNSKSINDIIKKHWSAYKENVK